MDLVLVGVEERERVGEHRLGNDAAGIDVVPRDDGGLLVVAEVRHRVVRRRERAPTRLLSFDGDVLAVGLVRGGAAGEARGGDGKESSEEAGAVSHVSP